MVHWRPDLGHKVWIIYGRGQARPIPAQPPARRRPPLIVDGGQGGRGRARALSQLWGNINGSFYPLDNCVLAAYLPRHINLEVDISTFSFIISYWPLTAHCPHWHLWHLCTPRRTLWHYVNVPSLCVEILTCSVLPCPLSLCVHLTSPVSAVVTGNRECHHRVRTSYSNPRNLSRETCLCLLHTLLLIHRQQALQLVRSSKDSSLAAQSIICQLCGGAADVKSVAVWQSHYWLWMLRD